MKRIPRDDIYNPSGDGVKLTDPQKILDAVGRIGARAYDMNQICEEASLAIKGGDFPYTALCVGRLREIVEKLTESSSKAIVILDELLGDEEASE